MSKKYKNKKLLENAFGIDEYRLLSLPIKISGRTISRFIYLSDSGGYSYCFPHGYETVNSHRRNWQRSWKNQRKTKWRTKKCSGVYVEDYLKFWSSVHSQSQLWSLGFGIILKKINVIVIIINLFIFYWMELLWIN